MNWVDTQLSWRPAAPTTDFNLDPLVREPHKRGSSPLVGRVRLRSQNAQGIGEACALRESQLLQGLVCGQAGNSIDSIRTLAPGSSPKAMRAGSDARGPATRGRHVSPLRHAVAHPTDKCVRAGCLPFQHPPHDVHCARGHHSANVLAAIATRQRGDGGSGSRYGKPTTLLPIATSAAPLDARTSPSRSTMQLRCPEVAARRSSAPPYLCCCRSAH
jgi:hypothetical protein